MATNAAEKTVTHDTGWVTDGHAICWNGLHGAMMGHPKGCPFYLENKARVYVCSPGCFVLRDGVTLDDLPDDEAAACREFDIGTEPISWRLVEYIHPHLTIHEQNALAVFEMKLDVEDHTDD